LADYQFVSGAFAALNASVFALCTDDLEHAAPTVTTNKIAYPVFYGLDGPATADLLGAGYEERRNIIQPAAFVLDPQRRIVSATRSTGPVGRLMAEEALRFINFSRQQAAAK